MKFAIVLFWIVSVCLLSMNLCIKRVNLNRSQNKGRMIRRKSQTSSLLRNNKQQRFSQTSKSGITQRKSPLTSKATQQSNSRRTKQSTKANSAQSKGSNQQKGFNAAQNKWAQLGIGIIIGASGTGDVEVSSLNSCLPDNWKIKEVSPINDSSSADQPKSTWTKILDGIQKVVDFVCYFKNKISSLFMGRIRKHKYRLFVTTNSYRRAAGFFSDLGNSVLSSIKKGINWATEKFDKYIGQAKKIVDNLKIFVSAVRDKVKAFLNSTTISTIMKWFNCLKSGAKIGMGIKDVVMGLISKIALIGNIAGGNYAAAVKLIIDLLCNFSIFRQAFSTLADAIAEKADVIRKFSLIGRFIGLLTRAILKR